MIVYNLGITIYTLFIRLASLFNPKAKQWVEGRKQVWEKLEKTFGNPQKTVWFHCASLGEFEQGRPLIEAFRLKYPNYKILLTFFSPSGYEIRKNYPGADSIFYLPADTASNAKRFISITKPDLAIFVKYEFWFNYLKSLNQAHIPLLIVSGKFRPSQHFFKWYGGFARKGLTHVTRFYVQDEASVKLLANICLNNVTKSGDTRFDRVASIATQLIEFEEVKQFCGSYPVLVFGSTWAADEDVFLPFLRTWHTNAKFIIAPHEVHPARIEALQKTIGLSSCLFSELKPNQTNLPNILIINNIGKLSQLYKYGTLAYIGGGFGVGTHNILEAATFGLPVIFGPNHTQFAETVELIKAGGAFSITTAAQFSQVAEILLSNPKNWKTCSEICRNFVKNNQGASKLIMQGIDEILNDNFPSKPIV
jgi:3-deoxy-D-manno-octulosonic-acid transferase